MNVKTNKTKAQKEIDLKVKAYFEGESALCKKLGIKKRLIVLFPKRPNGAPSWFGSLLLHLLRSQGGILDTEYTLIKK